MDLVNEDYIGNMVKRTELYNKLLALMERETLCSGSIRVQDRTEMEQQMDTGDELVFLSLSLWVSPITFVLIISL